MTRLVAIGFDPGLAVTGYGVVEAGEDGWHVLAGLTVRAFRSTTFVDVCLSNIRVFLK